MSWHIQRSVLSLTRKVNNFTNKLAFTPTFLPSRESEIYRYNNLLYSDSGETQMHRPK